MKYAVLPKATLQHVPDYAAWMPDIKEHCQEQTCSCVPLIPIRMASPLHASHALLVRQQIQVETLIYLRVYVLQATVGTALRSTHVLHVLLANLNLYLALMHALFVLKGSFRTKEQ